MKIYDTSLFYRYANLLRGSTAEPLTNGCDILFLAVANTVLYAVATVFALIFGAQTLAFLDIAEPNSTMLAVLMAIGTGYLGYLALYGLVSLIKPFCEKVEFE
tara:strand:- start:604 stop:912 length:309 start_codon:yes stop_codon:yes gene_type:complete